MLIKFKEICASLYTILHDSYFFDRIGNQKKRKFFKHSHQVRIIINLPWHRVVSAWILIVLLSFYTVLSLIGINADLIDNVCISFWSTGYLLLVPFVLLLPVAQKKCWSALGIFPICVLIIWQLASIELYGVQRQFLSWHELWDLISSSHTIVFVYSELLSVTVLVFIVFFYGVYYLLNLHIYKNSSLIPIISY